MSVTCGECRYYSPNDVLLLVWIIIGSGLLALVNMAVINISRSELQRNFGGKEKGPPMESKQMKRE